MNALTLESALHDQTPILAKPNQNSDASLNILDALKRAARPLLILGAVAVTASAPAPPAEILARAIHSRLPVTRTGLSDESEPLVAFADVHTSSSISAVAAERVDERSERNRRAAVRALASIGELSAWLNLSEERISDLAGFNRRSVTNWKSGGGVYPKTVRSLFEIHAIVSSAVRSMGPEETLLWLHQHGTEFSKARIETLGSPEGRRVLASELHEMIFAPAPQPEKPAFEDAAAEFVQAADPSLFGDPPTSRRPRPA
ncbi:hypothetical protein [Streptomyces griseus]|uniref:hypothetical protein n=1 Tax=Streptomyces griseus TaxID=1911 RepID=UPI0033CCBC1D